MPRSESGVVVVGDLTICSSSSLRSEDGSMEVDISPTRVCESAKMARCRNIMHWSDCSELGETFLILLSD